MTQQVTVDETASAIEQFNEAFNTHDLTAIMDRMTADCVFESTYPPPDGVRYEGQDAVRQLWEELFQDSPDAHLTVEEMFTVGDRCTVRWLMRYTGADDSQQHLRGVDVFRVRGGKVAEKFSYVKG